jgi:hypothetical protein
MSNEIRVDDSLGNSSRDCRINKYRLDDECESQSSTYLYYSELQAEAKDREGAAEDDLTKIKAEVELAYRKDPPGDAKVTEPFIKALVEVNKDVIAAKERLREAKKYRLRVDAVVGSLGHRKSMLDNLTVLWSKGYYMIDTGHVRTGRDAAQEDARKNLHRHREEKTHE